MINIRKKQIKKLFNDFIDTIEKGIWFFGVEGYGEYKSWYNNKQLKLNINYNKNGKRIGKYKVWFNSGQLGELINYNKKGELNGIYKKWYKEGDLIFEIEFKNNKLIGINYINFNHNRYWFNYYDQIQDKWVDFYDKIKEMYNNEKYKKKTN